MVGRARPSAQWSRPQTPGIQPQTPGIQPQIQGELPLTLSSWGECKQKNKIKSKVWGGHLWEHRGILAVELGLNPDFCRVLLAARCTGGGEGRLKPGGEIYLPNQRNSDPFLPCEGSLQLRGCCCLLTHSEVSADPRGTKTTCEESRTSTPLEPEPPPRLPKIPQEKAKGMLQHLFRRVNQHFRAQRHAGITADAF